MTQRIGILTAGDDAPGLNTVVRGLGKAVIQQHSWELVDFQDGMRGLTESHFTGLGPAALSGILTTGGTMPGTNRGKMHWMMADGEPRGIVSTTVDNCEKDGIDVLIHLGGGETVKNVKHLMDAGLNITHLPKTVGNDIVHTDSSFGFATALEIATQTINRLHSTAHSHHRIIPTGIMGHRASWLVLDTGIVSGTDIILLPEIPYSVDMVVDKIERRHSYESSFSVMAVAEGALPVTDHAEPKHAHALTKNTPSPERKAMARWGVKRLGAPHRANTFTLAEQLESLTGLEACVSTLGYVQCGGSPCGADHFLSTRPGVVGVSTIAKGHYGVMAVDRGQGTKLVPLKDMAGRTKFVPANHERIQAARTVGMALGD